MAIAAVAAAAVFGGCAGGTESDKPTPENPNGTPQGEQPVTPPGEDPDDVPAAAVSWTALEANGTSGTKSTNTLTFTFSQDLGEAFDKSLVTITAPEGKTAPAPDSVADKGGGVYELAIRNPAEDGMEFVVTLKDPVGWTITPKTLTVTTYKNTSSYTEPVDWTGLSVAGGNNPAHAILRFTFNKDMTDDFSAANITLTPSALQKGALSRSGKEYLLTVYGDWLDGTSVSASLNSPDGYQIFGSQSGSAISYAEGVAGLYKGATFKTSTRQLAAADSLLARSLIEIKNGAADGDGYYVVMDKDESLAAQTLDYAGKKVRLTLCGDATNRTVSGSQIAVNAGVALTLDKNLWLSPTVDVTSGSFTMNGDGYGVSTVKVAENGSFAMKGGTAYTVNVADGKSFTMTGGNILSLAVTGGGFTLRGGNVANGLSIGGGALTLAGGTLAATASLTLENGGSFTLSGGAIGPIIIKSGGSFTLAGGTVKSTGNYAHGVNVTGGTFTMSGGTVETSGSYDAYGVNVTGGTFEMKGGTVNAGSSYGVYVDSGSFTLSNGATFTGNSNYDVYVKGGSFTMNGGVVPNISATIADNNTFIMNGGTVSAGTVSVPNGKTFTMNGGSLYEVNASGGGTFVMKSGAVKRLSVKGDFALASGCSVTDTLTIAGGALTLAGGALAETAYLTLGDGGTFTMSDGTIKKVTINSGGAFTLDGGNVSNGSGVDVSGGSFTMNGGTISGNTKNYGGGVYVAGTFTMTGGTISGNTASYGSAYNRAGNGGGVYVSSGTFTMSGGTISGNTADCDDGGGVYVDSGGAFTMTGGTISDNSVGGVRVGGTFEMSDGTISGNSNTGVSVSGGKFTMSGGTISGNTSNNGAVGVYVNNGGTFTMSAGTISGNTSDNGGGVCVGDSTFEMNGGTISGNTASYGGGVYFNGGTFTMSGGTISGNTASYGGGVYFNYGSFTKTGGTIYGNNADSTLKNKAGSDRRGHAVYQIMNYLYRDTTADATVNLSNTDTQTNWKQ